MVTAAAPLIAELGPVAIAAAATLSVAAIASLRTIASFFKGNDLASRTDRTVDSYTVLQNDIAARAQYEADQAKLRAYWDQQAALVTEAHQKADSLAKEFISTAFATRSDLEAAFTALSSPSAWVLLSDDISQQVMTHYQTELFRIAAASTSTPAPTVSPPSTTLTNPAPTIEGVPLQGSGEVGGTTVLPTPTTSTPEVTGTGSASGAGALTATGIAAALVASATDLGCGLQRGTYACQDTGFANTMARILPSIAPLGIIAFLNNPTIAKEFTDPLTKAFLDNFIAMPEISKPIEPDDAPAVIRAVFSRAMGLGIGAHLASEVAESSTTLKYMGLNYIAAFLCDMAGFSKIAGATMGVVESQALALPMRYYINEKVRTEIPRMGDLLRMAEHYELTEVEFHQLAAYQNFSDALIDKYWAIAHRPAGYFMLRRMAASGLWDETYYTQALRDSGFDPDTVDHGLDMLYSEAHADLRAIGVSPAMTRFKEGLDTEEQLKTNLETLGVTQALIPKYVYAAKLSEDYDSYLDLKTAWQDSVAKGLSTPDDMKAALAKRGLDPTRAQQLADIASIKLYATPKKKPVS